MAIALALLSTGLYLLTALRIWRQSTATGAVPAIALLAHLGALSLALFSGGGLSINWTTALSLFTWQSAALLWLFSLRLPLQSLGLAVYPLAALGALAAGVWPESTQPVSGNWQVRLHVLLSLLSVGLLTLAAAQAILLALQERRLHAHQSRSAMRFLPPLMAMERALFQLVAVGFVLLSASLLTGLWFLQDWLAQHLAHKTVLSITAWVIFGGLLLARWRVGLRGKQATRWTLVGYCVLILAYFGSKFVLELLLGAHWRAL